MPVKPFGAVSDLMVSCAFNFIHVSVRARRSSLCFCIVWLKRAALCTAELVLSTQKLTEQDVFLLFLLHLGLHILCLKSWSSTDVLVNDKLASDWKGCIR